MPKIQPRGHVVLLGDSVFDNARYIPADQPDVVKQLRALLPDGWTASLNAVDGSITSEVKQQLDLLPKDSTHLVISSGGNDALRHANSGNELTVDELAEIQSQFRQEYHAMLDAVLARNRPTALCTLPGQI